MVVAQLDQLAARGSVESPSIWRDLAKHQHQVSRRPITSLFGQDRSRANRFAVACDDLYFDYSKTNLDEHARGLLVRLLDTGRVGETRAQVFHGSLHNRTERRAVLHTALRDLEGPPLVVGDRDVRQIMRRQHDKVMDFARKVRCGQTVASNGSRFSDVINLGIGGSDLGPAMGVAALSNHCDGPKVHFMSNIDSGHIADTLKSINPSTALVVICSKTFTTHETLTNARTTRDWLVSSLGSNCVARHLAAVSNAEDRTRHFGILPDQTFTFHSSIGGRYSIWGPVGLGLAIAVGSKNFSDMLAGGHAMDRHFASAPWTDNMPAMLALVGLWHHQVCGYPTRAVIPYEQRLALLPCYLQQLEMESNGKSVKMDGAQLDKASGPVVWGGTGTDSQHAFFQFLHQGTQVVPCEFLVGASGNEAGLAHHHRQLVANCLAQSEALLTGQDVDQTRQKLLAEGYSGCDLELLARHRSFPGNRPSTTLVYPRLTPYVLGQLIALYEHRVLVEGLVLGINSFDQWGVELGKSLAERFSRALQEEDDMDFSASSIQLARQIRALSGIRQQ